MSIICSRREKHMISSRNRKIKKYEKIFSAHKYSGKGKNYIEYLTGKNSIAIVATNSVKHIDEAEKPAEKKLGSLALILAKEIGAHAICARKKYEAKDKERISEEIQEYINNNRIKIIIDLHILESEKETVIFLNNDNSIGDKYDSLMEAIRYSFEYRYGCKENDKVVDCISNYPRGIVSGISGEEGTSRIYLGINRKYIENKNDNVFSFLFSVLKESLIMISNIDSNAEEIKVYRLWQSSLHKPQDKIEISFLPNTNHFENESLLNICTYGSGREKVRLHKPNAKTVKEIEENLSEEESRFEYVFLTNRLIEILFNREWIEGNENEPGLKGAPIIVYSNKSETYPIGLPKANQIDGVFFSSALFDEKKEEAEFYDYVLFNRCTDSRLHLDYKKADYSDHGRVKSSDGQPAKRIMIPRYYKRLLGYLDYPIKLIRREEYDGIINRLGDDEKKAFEICYERIESEAFYRLRSRFIDDENGESESDNDLVDRKYKDTVIGVLKRMGFYGNIELLRIPKADTKRASFKDKIISKLSKIRFRILKRVIGQSEYLLKTEWTSETDDRNNIARISPNMMSLLGVSENDKILVNFGNNQIILRVLANENLTDYQIGIPAPARKLLGMNSINDIVIVQRDMVHIFWRHSEEQTIAILGTVLAVFQVISKIWIGVVLCIIITPLIMYFVLSEERVKVK